MLVSRQNSEVVWADEVDQIFREYVRTLLQGNVLSVEDMVDVLSMRDNSESPDDYVIALRLLWGSDVSLPPS